jgi:hypothetical protein
MVQVDYRLFGRGWCMVDVILVYGTSWLQVEVQVDAWLMHLFMVQVNCRLFGTGWCMFDALVYGTG